MNLAELRHELRGALVWAWLSGEVDMSNSEDLRDELIHAVPNHALGLILDLSGVGYLDSAGIHVVYRLRESLRRRGQGLRLVVPSGSLVADTLRLAGINRGEDIVETAEEAERALAPSAESSDAVNGH